MTMRIDVPATLLFKQENGQEYALRLASEFRSQIDYRLQALLVDMSQVAWLWYNKQLTIVCLIRTKAENEAVGGKPDSSHLYSRAADLRSKTFTKEQIDELIAYIKQQWGPLVCILCHDSGAGMHFHVNINRQYALAEFNRLT